MQYSVHRELAFLPPSKWVADCWYERGNVVTINGPHWLHLPCNETLLSLSGPESLNLFLAELREIWTHRPRWREDVIQVRLAIDLAKPMALWVLLWWSRCSSTDREDLAVDVVVDQFCKVSLHHALMGMMLKNAISTLLRVQLPALVPLAGFHGLVALCPLILDLKV